MPYIARRMLVNRLPLPKSIDLSGKKPWELKHLATLALLTALFDIPTPKDDIDGSQVADVYYKERDVERISVYCEKAVLAVANLVLRLQGKDIYSADQMERV